MAKTHFDPTLSGRTITNEVPLHRTAYSGGVNGIEASNIIQDVECRVCIKKMLAPDYRARFTFDELEVLSSRI